MSTSAILTDIWPSDRRRANVKYAEAEALRLLEQFGIENPPVDPVSLARKLGIDVSFVSLKQEGDDVSGFYDYEEQKIFINRDEPVLRQTFTLAHELGHQILHPNWVATDEYKVYRRTNQIQDEHETEANAFAANLLMPRFMMDQYYDLPLPDISQIFAVSVPAVRARLQYLYGI